MLDPKLIEQYLAYQKSGKYLNEDTLKFSQPLEVENVDAVSVDCLLNTHHFQKAFVEERGKKYIKSGLLFLNSLSFDLAKEIKKLKQFNGVVEIAYPAALYLGGVFHALKNHISFNDFNDFSSTDGAIKLNITLGGEDFGVMSRLYEEYHWLIRDTYLFGTTWSSQAMRSGNNAGVLKSLKLTSKEPGEKNVPEYYGTYSVLNSTYDYTDLYNRSKFDSRRINNDKYTDHERFCITLAYLKQLMAGGLTETEAKNLIGDAMNNVAVREHLVEYSVLGKDGSYDKNNPVTLLDGVYQALQTEIAQLSTKYTDQFLVSLYPSGGGLSHIGPLWLSKDPVDTTNVYKRSCRFIWAQGGLASLASSPDPYITLNGYLDRLPAANRNGRFAIVSKAGYTHNMRLQELMDTVGIHNLEYFEEEFLNWVDSEKRSDFTDKLHFISALKAITLLTEDDFVELKLNDIPYTVEYQMGLITGYSLYHKVNDEANESTWLVNAFLTAAQFKKLNSVTTEFLNTKLALNNYTTFGMLKAGDYHMLIEQAPFRREFIFAEITTLNKGFLARKMIFGDQVLPKYDFIDVASATAIDPTKDYRFIPLIKYYDVRATNNMHVRICEFCTNINVSPLNENILKLLHPFITRYARYKEEQPSGTFDAFVDILIELFVTKMSVGYNKYIEVYKKVIAGLIDPNGVNSLFKVSEDQREELLDFKKTTYYNLRSLLDNNLYVPNSDFYHRSGDIDFASPELFKQPMFYNYTQHLSCLDMKQDPDTVNGRPKHLYEYVKILDRGNRDIGNDLLADLMWLRQEFKLTKDEHNPVNTGAIDYLTSSTYFSFLSAFSSRHHSLLHSLSSYSNLAATETDGEATFGVFNTLETVDGVPALVIQYIGEIESMLKTAENSARQKDGQNTPNGSFCMDVDFRNGVAQPTQDNGIPADLQEGTVSSFVVDFGAANQQIFKNIDLDTSQFTNTEASINAYVNLIKSEHNRQPTSSNLFSVVSQYSYSCGVEAMGNAMIQPLGYFYLKNVPLFVGSYWITNVSHKIQANVMTTSFKGVRQPMITIPRKQDVMIRLLKQNSETIKKVEEQANPNAPVTQADVNKFFTYGITKDQFTNVTYNTMYDGSVPKERIKIVMDTLQSKYNLSYMQAAVVTSNLMYESYLNPLYKQKGGPAYGLAQWENPRQAELIQRMRKDLGDNYEQARVEDAILVQLAFMFDGSNKEETRRIGQSRIRSATTIGEALFGFGRYYEGFAGSDNKDNMCASLTDTSIKGWKKRAVFARDIIGLKYPDLKQQAEEAASPGEIEPRFDYLTKRTLPAPLNEGVKLYGTKEKKGAGSNSTIVNWATELGITNYKSDDTAWCGLFVAITTKKAGFTGVKEPLRALDWLNFGVAVSTPVIGDVVVSTRSGGGHVGYYVGESDTHYYLLGGNQSDKVKIGPISKKAVKGFRRPPYTTQPDNLISYKVDSKGVVSEMKLS
jgi:uncharacterized protein (TIGR02594 family)